MTFLEEESYVSNVIKATFRYLSYATLTDVERHKWCTSSLM